MVEDSLEATRGPWFPWNRRDAQLPHGRLRLLWCRRTKSKGAAK